MPIGMPPGGPPPGGGYADQMRSRLPMGPGGAPSPEMPGLTAATGQPGAPGGIPPQALIQLLVMLLQKVGGGAPMPGGAMPPGVPPMAMMPNKPPGAY